MPYKLSEDGLSVLKEDGELVKKHDNKEKAKAHLAALEANVADAKSMFDLFFGDEEMKIGAMISASNKKKVQAMHDFCTELGAECKAKEEEMPEKSVAQVRESNLDLSYVKSLHIEIPENKLAVKYVGRNTIAHPVFVWGDTKKVDLDIEFFNRASDFWDVALKDFQRPLTWEHGQDEEFSKFEPNPVIGRTVKYYDDDVARWAESVIETDKKYRKFIDQFIDEKRLGYSSDSAPQYVVREKQGKATWLKMWPWFGGSLTASPCEPRMKVFTPEFLKSLGVQLPDVIDIQSRYEEKKRQAELLKLQYHKY